MPISNATTDSVELEILEIRQDSSDDDDELDAASKGIPRPCSPPRRKRFRRNRTSRRKSNSQSCGSLYNLSSIRPLYPPRSEPNVNFYVSGENEGMIDINFHVDDSSNTLDDAPVLESCESIGGVQTRSGRGSSGGTGTCSYQGRHGPDAGSGGGGGGFYTSGNGSIGADSGSGYIQYGFKASIVTVLEKLGMWNNAKVAKGQIHKSDTKSSFDRGQSYISNGAGRLRSIFAGKPLELLVCLCNR